jgi:hypothetical protein
MKKSMIIIFAVAIAILSSTFFISCDKKTTVAPEHGNTMVTMTYSPNPIVVNTPIEFNFSVMEDNTAKDVTDFTCELMMGSTNLNPMTLTKTGTGMYMGSYTFAMADSCKITFNFMHDGEMNMKDFMIQVK